MKLSVSKVTSRFKEFVFFGEPYNICITFSFASNYEDMVKFIKVMEEF